MQTKRDRSCMDDDRLGLRGRCSQHHDLKIKKGNEENLQSRRSEEREGMRKGKNRCQRDRREGGSFCGDSTDLLSKTDVWRLEKRVRSGTR